MKFNPAFCTASLFILFTTLLLNTAHAADPSTKTGTPLEPTTGCCEVLSEPGTCVKELWYFNCRFIGSQPKDKSQWDKASCSKYTADIGTISDPCPQKRDDDVSKCKKTGDSCTIKSRIDYVDGAMEKYECITHKGFGYCEAKRPNRGVGGKIAPEY